MTLRAEYYRVQQLFHGDGTPVMFQGKEVWVTRCGQEITGNRTDGLPGNMHPVLRLSTSPDTEVWVTKPCTRTPGPPLGPFPLGNHLATPLGASYDDGTGARAVYADGCVECFTLPPVCCDGVPVLPEGTQIRAVFTGRGQCACIDGLELLFARLDNGSLNNWRWEALQSEASTCGFPILPPPTGFAIGGIACSENPAPTWNFQLQSDDIKGDNEYLYMRVTGLFDGVTQQPISGATYSCSPFFIQLRGVSAEVDLQSVRQRILCTREIDITFLPVPP